MNTSVNAHHDVTKIIAELDERGYCVIPSVIAPEKADEARTVLEGLLAEEATEGTWRARTQRVARIAVKDPIFVELMAHPLIVSIWKAYLDEDVICSGIIYFTQHKDKLNCRARQDRAKVVLN